MSWKMTQKFQHTVNQPQAEAVPVRKASNSSTLTKGDSRQALAVPQIPPGVDIHEASRHWIHILTNEVSKLPFSCSTYQDNVSK